jgi:Fur family transcriptional regulator, iron response regulator
MSASQHSQNLMSAPEVEKFLHSHGVKPTPQRMVIAQYVLNTKTHPTADQIFQEVAQDLPVLLSRATVYNTLNTLVEAGALREVHIEAGPARYDANTGDHHHFVDVKTGKVLDIDCDKVPSIASELGPKFRVHHYSVTFFGELEESDKA